MSLDIITYALIKNYIKDLDGGGTDIDLSRYYDKLEIDEKVSVLNDSIKGLYITDITWTPVELDLQVGQSCNIMFGAELTSLITDGARNIPSKGMVFHTVDSSYDFIGQTGSGSGNSILVTARYNESGWGTAKMMSFEEFYELQDDVANLSDNLENINDNLDNMFPGGTNILRNTNTNVVASTTGTWDTGAWRPNSPTGTLLEKISITDSPDPNLEYGWRLTRTSAATADITLYQTNIPFLAGHEYTVFFYARKVSGNGSIQVSMGLTGSYVQDLKSVGTEWVPVSFKFVPTIENGYLVFRLRTSDGENSIEICGESLKVGNKATGWSPNPQDITNSNSDWITAELRSDFVPYNNTEPYTPQYRKEGNGVWIRGVVSPASASNSIGSTTTTTIFTLPSEYSPDAVSAPFLMCGTSADMWMLEISTTGAVRASRYRDGNGYKTPGTTAWMPFNVFVPLN